MVKWGKVIKRYRELIHMSVVENKVRKKPVIFWTYLVGRNGSYECFNLFIFVDMGVNYCEGASQEEIICLDLEYKRRD